MAKTRSATMSNHNIGGENRRARKRALIARDGSICHYCGIASDVLTLDHIVPRSAGGANAMSNLCLACQPCNRERGTTDYSLFKEMKEAQMKEVDRYARIHCN